MSKPRRIRITHVHKEDGYYDLREGYIGLTGTFDFNRITSPGYYSGQFRTDDHKVSAYFLGIRYRRIR